MPNFDHLKEAAEFHEDGWLGCETNGPGSKLEIDLLILLELFLNDNQMPLIHSEEWRAYMNSLNL